MRAVDAAVVVRGQAVLDLLEHQTAVDLRLCWLVVDGDSRGRQHARHIGGIGDANALHLIGRVDERGIGDAGNGIRRGRPCTRGADGLGVEGVLLGQFAPVSTPHQLVPRGVHQGKNLHHILIGVTRHRSRYR